MLFFVFVWLLMNKSLQEKTKLEYDIWENVFLKDFRAAWIQKDLKYIKML